MHTLLPHTVLTYPGLSHAVLTYRAHTCRAYREYTKTAAECGYLALAEKKQPISLVPLTASTLKTAAERRKAAFAEEGRSSDGGKARGKAGRGSGAACV